MTIFCPGCHKDTTDDPKCGHCGRDTRLNGRWVLEEMVGHGASGYTWRARDAESGELVAIKELSFRRLTDLKAIELFEREVRALESITHPGIPRFIDEFTVEEDRFVSGYLVQEFIDGSVIDLTKRTTEAEVLNLLEEMAGLLKVLHSMRPPVIHRDIKPANVMRRKDGRYVLIDFGAIRASTEKSMGGSTMAGTPGYMAPEQLLGKAEPASDFYGLGATAVAMLAGKDAHDLIDSHDPTKWRKKVQVSDGLGSLLEAMLRPKSAERIRSSKALRRAIREAKAAESRDSKVAETLAPVEVQPESRVVQVPRGPDTPKVQEQGRVFSDSTNRRAAALVWGGLSLVIIVASYERFASKSFPFIWEVVYGSAGGELGSVFSLLGMVCFGSFLVFLGLVFVSMFWTNGNHEYLRPAIFSPMLGILMVAYQYGPIRISEKDTFWVGERNGEFRVSVIGKTQGLLQVSTFGVPDGELIAVNAVRGDCSGFSEGLDGCRGIQITPSGNAWFRGEAKATLWDLWSAEKIFDVSSVVNGLFIPKEVDGEQLRVDLPDQEARPFGPETAPKPTRWGTLQSMEGPARRIYYTLESEDGIRYPSMAPIQLTIEEKLNRHKLFFEDSSCGYLVRHNTIKEGFGPGEELLSGADQQAIKWTRPVQNMIGKDTLVGAIGGTSKCLLVAKSSSRLKFYTWNPETGATEFFFSLKHGKPSNSSDGHMSAV